MGALGAGMWKETTEAKRDAMTRNFIFLCEFHTKFVSKPAGECQQVLEILQDERRAFGAKHSHTNISLTIGRMVQVITVVEEGVKVYLSSSYT